MSEQISELQNKELVSESSAYTPFEEFALQASTRSGYEGVAKAFEEYNKEEGQTQATYDELMSFADFPANLSSEEIDEINKERKNPIGGQMMGLPIFDARTMIKSGMTFGELESIVALPPQISLDNRMPTEWALGRMVEGEFSPLNTTKGLILNNSVNHAFKLQETPTGVTVSLTPPIQVQP